MSDATRGESQELESALTVVVNIQDSQAVLLYETLTSPHQYASEGTVQAKTEPRIHPRQPDRNQVRLLGIEVPDNVELSRRVQATSSQSLKSANREVNVVLIATRAGVGNKDCDRLAGAVVVVSTTVVGHSDGSSTITALVHPAIRTNISWML